MLFLCFCIFAVACGGGTKINKVGTKIVATVSPKVKWRSVSDQISDFLCSYSEIDEIQIVCRSKSFSIDVPPQNRRIIGEEGEIRWDIGIAGFDRFLGQSSTEFGAGDAYFYACLRYDGTELLGPSDLPLNSVYDYIPDREFGAIVVNLIVRPETEVSDLVDFVQNYGNDEKIRFLISCGYATIEWPPFSVPYRGF